jgi:flagella basal body P-ring formation protein FlgA
MRQLPALVFLLALAVPAQAQVTSALTLPSLKAEVTVTGDIVRIGDLVEHAGAAANIPVFRAPDLGETGTVPVARVIEALRPHAVIGLDTRDLNEVTVTHASRTITLEEIETHVAQALAGKYGLGDAKDISVILDREAHSIHVEASATAPLQVSRLSFDPRSRRFDVSFELPGSAIARRNPLHVTGTVADTVAAVVIVRPLARGDIARAADLAIEKRPRSQIIGDVVRETQSVVGLSVRRALAAGQVVRNADLMKPLYVTRNEAVTLVYEVPGILLTLRGKALDSGAEGDMVSVLNVQSKRTVEGVVTGPGRVTISSITPRLAQNIASVSSQANSTARRRAE